MTRTDFDALVARVKARRPLWFELQREAPFTDQDLADFETSLGVQLPRQYRDFLSTHGAGTFAFLKVLGLNRGTPRDLSSQRPDLPVDFIPVADLETGDYYGYRVVDGRCEERVSVWDHDARTVQRTLYEDFYALVAAVGLNS